jgi:hypothetical protein
MAHHAAGVKRYPAKAHFGAICPQETRKKVLARPGLAAHQVERAQEQHEVAVRRLQRRSVHLAEVGDRAEPGARPRSSQISSRLRCASCSSRREERTRLR